MSTAHSLAALPGGTATPVRGPHRLPARGRAAAARHRRSGVGGGRRSPRRQRGGDRRRERERRADRALQPIIGAVAPRGPRARLRHGQRRDGEPADVMEPRRAGDATGCPSPRRQRARRLRADRRCALRQRHGRHRRQRGAAHPGCLQRHRCRRLGHRRQHLAGRAARGCATGRRQPGAPPGRLGGLHRRHGQQSRGLHRSGRSRSAERRIAAGARSDPAEPHAHPSLPRQRPPQRRHRARRRHPRQRGRPARRRSQLRPLAPRPTAPRSPSKEMRCPPPTSPMVAGISPTPPVASRCCSTAARSRAGITSSSPEPSTIASRSERFGRPAVT